MSDELTEKVQEAPEVPETPAAEDPAESRIAREPDRKSCRQCGLWDEVKERVRIAELLESALGKLESRLTAQDFKPTIADYLKLMQLEKEFEQEDVKEIKVTWVETAPSSEPGK